MNKSRNQLISSVTWLVQSEQGNVGVSTEVWGVGDGEVRGRRREVSQAGPDRSSSYPYKGKPGQISCGS